MSEWQIPEHLLFLDGYGGRMEKEWRSGKLAAVILEPLLWAISRRWDGLGVPSVVTSLWRSAMENKLAFSKSNTHPQWRAIDLGVVAKWFPLEEKLRLEVNERWPTGPGGKERVPPFDHAGKHRLHWHFQAMPWEAPHG